MMTSLLNQKNEIIFMILGLCEYNSSMVMVVHPLNGHRLYPIPIYIFPPATAGKYGGTLQCGSSYVSGQQY